MAQENDQSSTNSDTSRTMKQTFEKQPNILSKFEKLSKNVSQIKCRIITVDEIVAVVNTKEKGLLVLLTIFTLFFTVFFFNLDLFLVINELRESIKEKDKKIKNFTTQNDVLLEACTALSQQSRELSQQNKETLVVV